MSTTLVLGNSSMLVNINHEMKMSDLYWPNVGQENHLNKTVNDLYLWVDGSLHNINEWDCHSIYEKNSLVGISKLTNKQLNVDIEVQEAVLHNQDAHIRIFKLVNNSNLERRIRLFALQRFHVKETDIGDTCLWYPPANAMVHYKKDRYIATATSVKLYQFTCAAPEDNEGRGALPDSNGELKFNQIATGEVESSISIERIIQADSSVYIDLITVCGHCFDDVQRDLESIRDKGSLELIKETNEYWKSFIKNNEENLSISNLQIFPDENDNKKLIDIFYRSQLIIRTQTDKNGAIIAANDSTYLKEGGKDSYAYFWPRDAAFAAKALIDIGDIKIAKNYIEYCANLIDPRGFLLHRYYSRAQSGLASSWHPWISNDGSYQLPIQIDETALMLTIAESIIKSESNRDWIKKYWTKLIKPAADFLVDYRFNSRQEITQKFNDHIEGFIFSDKGFDTGAFSLEGSGLPRLSYDIWEVRQGVFCYSTAAVYAGLLAASAVAMEIGELDHSVRFRQVARKIRAKANELFIDKERKLISAGIFINHQTGKLESEKGADASVLLALKLNLFEVDEEIILNTVRFIEEKLWLQTDIGGLARKESDWYLRVDNELPGNPWFITTAWLAEFWASRGNIAKVQRYTKWIMDHADITGLIAEQAHPYNGYGISVKPLTWSHTEVINLVNTIMKLDVKHLLT